ncbi:MAG: hypothetical protein AVDCRST_MAG83-1927, partial [uncultured Arthrobacter sp.]
GRPAVPAAGRMGTTARRSHRLLRPTTPSDLSSGGSCPSTHERRL